MEVDPRHRGTGVSVDACVRLVERGDPDRFLAVMAAPPAARARLFPLYAFNLEVARASWVTRELLIAEMRLQWWRDVVENAASGAARAHEVAGPLHDLIRQAGLPVPVLVALIEARRWDAYCEPHAGIAGLEAYLEATGAGLMWLAARALGAPDGAEPAVRAYGWAAAAAAYLRAVPELTARGRQPLPEGVTGRMLAVMGLEKLATARAARHLVPRFTLPALLAGWQTGSVLARAAAEQENLELSEFSRRGGLLWHAMTGRW